MQAESNVARTDGKKIKLHSCKTFVKSKYIYNEYFFISNYACFIQIIACSVRDKLNCKTYIVLITGICKTLS